MVRRGVTENALSMVRLDQVRLFLMVVEIYPTLVCSVIHSTRFLLFTPSDSNVIGSVFVRGTRSSLAWWEHFSAPDAVISARSFTLTVAARQTDAKGFWATLLPSQEPFLLTFQRVALLSLQTV